MIRVFRKSGFSREFDELAVCSRLKPLLQLSCSDKVFSISVMLSTQKVIHTTMALLRSSYAQVSANLHWQRFIVARLVLV